MIISPIDTERTLFFRTTAQKCLRACCKKKKKTWKNAGERLDLILAFCSDFTINI